MNSNAKPTKRSAGWIGKKNYELEVNGRAA
jgi:hypothetical protein